MAAGNLPPKSVATLAVAYAHLGLPYGPLFQALGRAMLVGEAMSLADDHGIANVAWAFAKLRIFNPELLAPGHTLQVLLCHRDPGLWPRNRF